MNRYERTLAILKQAKAEGIIVQQHGKHFLVEGPLNNRTHMFVAALREHKREAMLLAELYMLIDKPLLADDSDRLDELACRFGLRVCKKRYCLNEWDMGWQDVVDDACRRSGYSDRSD